MIAAMVTYFVNSLWQVPLLGLCAWLALRVARASARVRYAVWIGALVVGVLLPLRGVEWRSGGQVEISAVEYAGVLPAMPVRPWHLPMIAIGISPGWANVLALVYLGLTAGCVVRLVRAQVTVGRLRAGSLAWSDEDGLRLLTGAARTPLVVGVVRPMILLPAWMREVSGDELATVLAHERAHIRRHDLAMNAALRVLVLPVAYHPATAWMERRVRQARELLVDAEAARAMGSRARYAASLLTLADRMIGGGPGMSSEASAMLLEESSQNQLEERLMNLIQVSSVNRPATRASRVVAGCAVLLSAAALAAVVHVSPQVLAAQSAAATPVQAEAKPAAAEAVKPWAQSTGSDSMVVALPKSATPPAVFVMNVPKPADVDSQVQVVVPPVEMKGLDPEAQERLRKLSAEIAKSTVNSAEFKRSMEEMRRRFDSPEFKKQMEEMSAQASKLATMGEAQRKMAAEMERRMNTPEFRRQLAQIEADAVKMEKEIAAAHLEQFNVSKAPETQGPPRVNGGVLAGQKIGGDQPVYPPDAKAARIQGSVVLQAVIGTDGAISSLEAVSGPEELREAAMKAVKTWVYKPYLLNGEPTAVETKIEVTFTLN